MIRPIRLVHFGVQFSRASAMTPGYRPPVAAKLSRCDRKPAGQLKIAEALFGSVLSLGSLQI